MEQTRNKTEQLEWRRNKVNELSIKGFGLTDISKMLQIPKTTISRDIEFLKQEAKETIRNHIQEKLPYEYKKCISGLEEIIKEAWVIADNGNTKDKLQSLALIKDTYNTKMDLLTNASLLQDSIKFVEQSKDKLPSGNFPQGFEDQDQEEKEVLENRIQGPTEDNITESEQYNEVF